MADALNPAPAAQASEAARATRATPRLGLLIPCRNEAAVIERKLRNLALLDWPGGQQGQRIVVIDDGSDDDTAALARRSAKQLFAEARSGLTIDVLSNNQRPGKAGAIATGLAALGDSVELIVLSDADVILHSDALAALARCFADSPQLGMACGSQEFVVDLAADGTTTGRDGGPLRPAPGRYDRWTAAVRGLESRWGKLFSIHGQLLAWRADLGLCPSPGIAADDIDLMRQTRALGRTVIKSPAARFVEIKTPAGPHRAAQQRRRAQAYFQVIDSCHLPPGSSWLERAHFALYRLLPGAVPRACLVALLAAPLLSWCTLGSGAALIAALLLSLGLASPPGRHVLRLLLVIESARRAQRAADLGDRWQTPR